MPIETPKQAGRLLHAAIRSKYPKLGYLKCLQLTSSSFTYKTHESIGFCSQAGDFDAMREAKAVILNEAMVRERAQKLCVSPESILGPVREAVEKALQMDGDGPTVFWSLTEYMAHLVENGLSHNVPSRLLDTHDGRSFYPHGDFFPKSIPDPGSLPNISLGGFKKEGSPKRPDSLDVAITVKVSQTFWEALPSAARSNFPAGGAFFAMARFERIGPCGISFEDLDDPYDSLYGHVSMIASSEIAHMLTKSSGDVAWNVEPDTLYPNAVRLNEAYSLEFEEEEEEEEDDEENEDFEDEDIEDEDDDDDDFDPYDDDEDEEGPDDTTPGPNDTCEFHPDRPATVVFEVGPLCDDCAEHYMDGYNRD